MLLAKPLHAHSFSAKDVSEDSTQYRSSQDFKSLLAPIEFVEGSSSGGLAVPEGKYEPINGTPKAKKASKEDLFKDTHKTPSKAVALKSASSKTVASLYNGNVDTTWPTGTSIGSGLYNNGNTCFLNSALQCLLHTPPLLNVLIKHGKKEECRVTAPQFCMSCSLRKVMMDSHTGKRPFLPKDVSGRLNVIAKHMRKGRQEDAHEFLRYAIDALQKSCLAGMSPKIDPKIAETTWVHKIFGGRLRSRVACRECHHNSDTFDSILDLSLDINRQSSIKEALHHFVKVDTLKGADKYKCEKCKKPVIADKNFTIHDAPMVLTVHLKRFSPLGRKITHPIQYDERLSLQPVMSEDQFGPSYSLYGVICHAGSGPNSGHYYAHVKGAKGQWHEMNDESVTMSSRTPSGLKNAYMLFYVQDKGQVLKAAVNQVATPAKNGVAAAMKKRKGGGNDQDDTGVPTARPFIGPVLPSSTAAASPSSPTVVDPQAEIIRRKIAATAAAKTSQAMQGLSQYGEGDSDSDMDAPPEELPSSSAAATPYNTQSSPPAIPPASSPVTTPISAGDFYTNGKDKGKKRKSPDGQADENRHGDLSSPSSFSRDKADNPRRRLKYTGNPYNNMSGPRSPRKLTKRRRGLAV